MGEVLTDEIAWGMAAIVILFALLYLANPKDQPPWPTAVKPEEPQPESEPVCSCEYIDVGIGMMLAEPDPECEVHSLEMLAMMTYSRHMAEREMGIEAVRTHWAHNGCPCGCGDAA